MIHILLDLGPACTTNVGTLREALRLVTQKLPSNNNNNNNSDNSWKESGVARLLHFFSAVGTKPTNTSTTQQGNNNNNKDNLSAAFVGAYLNNPDFNKQSNDTGGGEWNLDVISSVLSTDYKHLNWTLVGRSLDFPEFKVRDTKHLEVLLALYGPGSSSSSEQQHSNTVQTSARKYFLPLH